VATQHERVLQLQDDLGVFIEHGYHEYKYLMNDLMSRISASRPIAYFRMTGQFCFLSMLIPHLVPL
jgi:hypothetical protein